MIIIEMIIIFNDNNNDNKNKLKKKMKIISKINIFIEIWTLPFPPDTHSCLRCNRSRVARLVKVHRTVIWCSLYNKVLRARCT